MLEYGVVTLRYPARYSPHLSYLSFLGQWFRGPLSLPSINFNMPSNDGADVTGSRYLDDQRFHQSFTLPPDANRPSELKVTYADFGHQNDERVLLFCGPLFGR